MSIHSKNTPEVFVKWLAQTVHQAYHTEHPGTWETCPKDICASVRHWLKEDASRIEKILDLLENLKKKKERERKVVIALLEGLKEVVGTCTDNNAIKTIDSLVENVSATLDFYRLSEEQQVAMVLRHGTPLEWKKSLGEDNIG